MLGIQAITLRPLMAVSIRRRFADFGGRRVSAGVMGIMHTSSDDLAAAVTSERINEHDLALIDEMLALSPEARLAALEETLLSLEALRAATGSAAPTE
jgi:hypothetical protein